MAKPTFRELPFQERPDLTPFLIHLTKNTKEKDGCSAYDNLVNILKSGQISGSSGRGFIKGGLRAACFMDVPLLSLKYILNHENADPDHPRYEPFGILVDKLTAYKQDCRPVLYLSDDEQNTLDIPKPELWRVVNFELSDEGCISWVHEREWRRQGDYVLPKIPQKFLAVLVKDTTHAMKLAELLAEKPGDFKALPMSIIPLSIVCQGLNYLKAKKAK